MIDNIGMFSSDHQDNKRMIDELLFKTEKKFNGHESETLDQKEEKIVSI